MERSQCQSTVKYTPYSTTISSEKTIWERKKKINRTELRYPVIVSCVFPLKKVYSACFLFMFHEHDNLYYRQFVVHFFILIEGLRRERDTV